MRSVVVAAILMAAVASTAACLGISYPAAYFIAGCAPKWRNVLLFLVVLPFWTNLLIRTYAWQILFAPEAPLTRVAAAVGLVPMQLGLRALERMEV